MSVSSPLLVPIRNLHKHSHLCRKWNLIWFWDWVWGRNTDIPKTECLMSHVSAQCFYTCLEQAVLMLPMDMVVATLGSSASCHLPVLHYFCDLRSAWEYQSDHYPHCRRVFCFFCFFINSIIQDDNTRPQRTISLKRYHEEEDITISRYPAMSSDIIPYTTYGISWTDPLWRLLNPLGILRQLATYEKKSPLRRQQPYVSHWVVDLVEAHGSATR